ncbi:MAG: hypothetical protein AAGA42_16550 [Actinomycetota bacterium]
MTSSTTPDESPPFACDRVMKGGITSGVVYPPAIVELARDHRLYNIGGASAGAIAAVAAAAAEYGRQTGGGGFEVLAGIPDELATTDPTTGETKLQGLFVPQDSTRTYFDLIWQQRKLGDVSAFARARSLVPTVLARSSVMPAPIVALAAFALPIAAIVWLVLDPTPATIAVAVLALFVGAVVYIVARIVAGARALLASAPAQLKENRHGLCSGASVGDQVGLTEWLHERIEQMAGPTRVAAPPEEQRPLTYGDLQAYEIGLITLTTNLSQSSSENFPFDDNTWAFAPDDMTALFPPAVAQHIIDRGSVATRTSSQREQLEHQGLLQLPPPDELPIVLGARISLSFPVLLSAIPLWRLTPVRHGDAWETEYHEVWLSDGGICSNLPVHLFDAPLPSRPTYGINLSPGTTGPLPTSDDEAVVMSYAHDNVWRPIGTGSGRTTPVSDIDSTVGLLSRVLTTMQNWSDNSMTRALGVRDRICTIRLGATEGGMNLDMPTTTIEGLGPRGVAAGQNLAWMVRGERPPYSSAAEDDDIAGAQWTRHRWTRLRSTARGVGDYLQSMAAGREKTAVPQAGGAHPNNYDYDDLAERANELTFLPYRSAWNDAASASLTGGIDALGRIDLSTANDTSPPPLRKLQLGARSAPEPEGTD